MNAIKRFIWRKLTAYLTANTRPPAISPNDFNLLRQHLKPGDVLLVEGRTRVGQMIKNITRSPWSHSAIAIGRLDEIDDLTIRQRLAEHYTGDVTEPLLIEAELGRGTVVTPLSFYEPFHVRVCRPIGLSETDATRVAVSMIDSLGSGYNVKQLIDLARFMFPWWSIVPRRWHNSLFEHNAGEATNNVCSSLIAQAFQKVGFPVLPVVHEGSHGYDFYRRNPKLITPRDFDYSPFFEVIKYSKLSVISDEGYYRRLNWQEGESTHPNHAEHVDAGDVVFVQRHQDETTEPVDSSV